MRRYQHLTEDELFELADEKEQLTDVARIALESELSRRNLSTAEVNAPTNGNVPTTTKLTSFGAQDGK